jgi:hypothetical protein
MLATFVLLLVGAVAFGGYVVTRYGLWAAFVELWKDFQRHEGR